MTTLGTALQESIALLRAAGVDEAVRTAEWLVEAAAGVSRARLYAFPEAPLEAAQAARLRTLVDRRADGEPVQYVLGTADFFGLTLEVTPAVLIPRPETEEVVAAAAALLDGLSAPRVADAGTGSGCIALALKHLRPDAHVWGFDVSVDALAVARANARRLGLDVSFARADLLAPDLASVPGDLDLLVSNPPYIPLAERATLARHVRDFEPAHALFSGPEPYRFYEAIARHAHRCVRQGGAVVVETHADFADGVALRFAASGLTDAAVHRDLSGRPRIVTARRGGGA